MGKLLRRLRYLLRPTRHDADLRDEINTHRSLRKAQLERDGFPSDHAERASRYALGNDHLAREEARNVWTFGWLERIWQDLATGARILRTAPGLTVTAIALIALVIGGNATIYSMVHGILTKGAPGVEADGLFTLTWTDERGEVWAEKSYEQYLQIAEQSKTLSALLACNYQRVALGTEGGTYFVRAGLVSQNYFETLRIRLVKGRAPSPEESRPDAAGLVGVISHRIWQEQFGGVDDVVGRSLTINGQHVTIVGVAPPLFHGAWLGEFFDAWLPFSSYPQVVRIQGEASDGRAAPVLLIGRLRPGVTRTEALAELTTVSARLHADERDGAPRAGLVPYSITAGGNNVISARGGTFLAVFSVVTLLTLLIVSANVANLMLGRAVNRQREIAVRRSLGCSHFRVVRMLVAEGLVVAGLAWIASLAFAWMVAGLLARAIPPPQGAGAGFAEWFMRPDWNVAAYAMILAGLATVACVLGPVIYAWRQPLTPSLKAGEHSVVRGRSRLSRGLVVLQLSLSVLLVAIAGLAWRSLAAGNAVDIGFEPDNILIATVSTVGRVDDRHARARLLEEVRDRLQAVRGVTVVSYADSAPRDRGWSRQPVHAEASSESTSAEVNRVAPDFLAAHGLELVAGQDLSRTSQPGRVTALVNQELAETLWPGTSPLGRRVLFGEEQARQAEVVGVVPNAFFSGFRRQARPNFVLFSAVDDPASGAGYSARAPEVVFYVRFNGRLDRVTSGVREVLGPRGIPMPIVTLTTMDSLLATIMTFWRMLTTLLAAFGIGALLIATLGQYSVVLFDMRRRVREFGVRLALGASPRRLQSSVLREGARLSIIGLVVGGALSLVVGRLMSGLLYGVSAIDGTTYVSVAVLLAVTTLAACAIPARLASRVDPLRALREE
jgi:predicted permease